MSRRRMGEPPSYRLHKQSGQAIVSLPLGGNKYRDILLGPHGSDESKQAYARALLECSGAGGLASPPNTGGQFSDIRVSEVCLRFWRHAETYYRLVDGSPSGELNIFRHSLEPLVNIYGETEAKHFGPVALKAVRQHMINGGRLCRLVINHRIDHVKRAFKWAVSEELVPPSVYEGLRAVAGLRRGHAGTYDHPKVQPVPHAHIQAVLPLLPPQVAAMVQLQTLMGMRPGEIRNIRGRDIVRNGSIWWYRINPNYTAKDGTISTHKTANSGNPNDDLVEKQYAIGPKAQEILQHWLRADEDEFLFQPKEAREFIYQQRRSRRKTPMTPSQRARKPKSNPRCPPRDHYDKNSYTRVIGRACEKAGIPKWHPHQLRHTCGTDVCKQFGVEGARLYLGQQQISTTEIYAEKDMERVAEIANQMG